MKYKNALSSCVIASCLGLTSLSAQKTIDSFNGKDLSVGSEKDQFWKVENGTIIGETTEDNPTSANTFSYLERRRGKGFRIFLSGKISGK
jgi:hypothetical protein